MTIELDKRPTKERTYGTNAITGKQEPWRDGNGQYRFLHPEKGALRSYKRASSIGDVLEDKYGLHQWEMRMVARGLGLRKDLYHLAAGHDPNQDRAVYDGPEGVIANALGAAKANEASNQGTALHRETELLDLGQVTNIADRPDDFQDHLKAYADKLATSGFAVVPEHIEQIIINDDYGLGGQIDRILIATRDVTVELPDGKSFVIPIGTLIVGDLKTGASIPEYKYIEFSIQVTIYANHTATWHVDHDHPNGGTRGERIDVNRNIGLIIHLPSTDPDAPCTLHWVDLDRGYDYFLHAMDTHRLRSAPVKRQLICQYEPDEVETAAAKLEAAFGQAPAPVSLPTPPLSIRLLEWVTERVQVIEARSTDTVRVMVYGVIHVIPIEQTAVENCGFMPGATVTTMPGTAMSDLQRQWPIRDDHGHFAPLPPNPSIEQIDLVATVLDRIEAAYQIPFGDKRPTEEQGPSEIAKVLHIDGRNNHPTNNGNHKGN